MWNWLKDNAAALLVLLAALALIHNSNNTVHHRLDDIRADTNQRIDAVVAIIDRLQNAMNQRFDAQDERLDSLASEVSGLRKLTVGIIERMSRNEGEIDVIRQQLQTADKPSP